MQDFSLFCKPGATSRLRESAEQTESASGTNFFLTDP